MKTHKKSIALLLGDPSGIGPELISKLLSEEIINKQILLLLVKKIFLKKEIKFQENHKI